MRHLILVDDHGATFLMRAGSGVSKNSHTEVSTDVPPLGQPERDADAEGEERVLGGGRDRPHGGRTGTAS